MNVVLEPWDEDVVFLRSASTKDNIVLDDDLEDDYCTAVWALWNMGVSKELSREIIYRRMFHGEYQHNLEPA